jgi:hypothetical protein
MKRSLPKSDCHVHSLTKHSNCLRDFASFEASGSRLIGQGSGSITFERLLGSGGNKRTSSMTRRTLAPEAPTSACGGLSAKISCPAHGDRPGAAQRRSQLTADPMIVRQCRFSLACKTCKFYKEKLDK